MFRSRRIISVVMAGLVPAIHALLSRKKTWMRGSSPRMTAPMARPMGDGSPTRVPEQAPLNAFRNSN